MMPSATGLLVVRLLWAAGLVFTASATAQPIHELCSACHTDVAKDFLKHAHFQQGLSCDACHGPSKAHRESAGGAEPDRIAGPLQVPALCGTCHDRPAKGETDPAKSILKQYQASKHGMHLETPSKVRAPHCGTCHDVHGLRPLRAMQIRCQRCHSHLPEACGEHPAAAGTSELRCAACHEPHLFAVPQ